MRRKYRSIFFSSMSAYGIYGADSPASTYEQYEIDVLMYGPLYTTGGAAGVPAINIPVGFKLNPETGEQTREPAGVAITGPYLSDAKLIAVGYALEQAMGGYTAPDLDTTIEGIEAVTGQ